VCFLDIEATQYKFENLGLIKRNATPIWADNQEISVIGCYDSYTEKYVIWAQHEHALEHLEGYDYTVTRDSKTMVFDGVKTEIRAFTTEYTLLADFITWWDRMDFDQCHSWAGHFYDFPTLYTRLEANGIGGYKLSPSSLGDDRWVEPPSKWLKDRYRWTDQPVAGRTFVSLDKLFQRVYKDSHSTELPSNKLDIVGQKLFGRGKTDFRPDFFDRDYHLFLSEYLYYNFRDVLLMVEIDEKYNLINGQAAFQNLIGCQWRSTYYGSGLARTYFMRKANFIQKTGWQDDNDDDDKLQGAIVLDPEDLGTVGLHKNVVVLDFAGLYPSVMVTYNTSWETKIKPGEESDDDIIGDGCRFRRSPQGILPTCVKELDGLRDHYKALMREAASKHGKTSSEYKKWDTAQKSVKRLRATFYGLMAFQGFAWSDMDLAKTITYGGRTALKRIMKASEDAGYKVLYGHTDSIFVGMGDDLTKEDAAAKAQQLGVELTKICQEEFQTEALVVEAEVLMDRFYLPRRNRYGGRIVWQPETGHSIANIDVEDRMKIQGLEAKHANTSPAGRGIQLLALKEIWDDNSPSEVKASLLEYIDEVRSEDYPVDNLLARARLGQWLNPSFVEVGHYAKGATNQSARSDSDSEDYKCYANLSGTARGAAFHNIVLANDEYGKLDKDDSFYTTFVKDGPTWIPSGGYIGFHDVEQISEYEIDVEKIIEKHIVGKLDHIMYGIGMSLDDLRPEKKSFKVSEHFG
jgi:DNA polymerase elongation subunit (family B)